MQRLVRPFYISFLDFVTLIVTISEWGRGKIWAQIR